MLDVHVVTSANRALYAQSLDLFHEWRYRIYVEEKGWMPPREDRREIDQFDGDDAHYLLAYRGADFVAGSRLRPFSAPTLLAEVFPHLAGGRGLPTTADRAEWTRMFVVPGNREKGHKGVAAAMCCAVMEYCLEEKIAWMGGIQETYWLPRWADYGWSLDVLGLPQDVDGVSCVAAMFRVDAQALAGVQESANIRGSQIVRHGPQRSFLTGRIRTIAEPVPQTPEPRLVLGTSRR